MKNFLVVLFLSVAVVSVQADEQPEQIVLTQTVNASFGKVWDAIKEAMTEFGCPKPQTDKADRAAHPGSARPPHDFAHELRHRTPAIDGSARGSDSRDGSRPHRRARTPRRAAQGRRPLRAAL